MNTLNWEKIDIEYLEENITLKVPSNCEVLKMRSVPPLKEIKKIIESAFDHPIDSKTIEEIILSHTKCISEMTVAIAVSDNTRPVPYHCEYDESILLPILSRLTKVGINRKNIKIIISTGTHAPTSAAWKEKSFGEKVFQDYCLIDHDCYAKDLVSIGEVMGVPIKVNKDFVESDIHIVTGLVEAHFMAGASGGRKAICPGMINIEATQVFHGPEFIANENANNLIFKGNPCHEFALEVARKVRVDYSVNVLINGSYKICGIYTGELEKSHQKAVEQLEHISVVNLEKEYDIVLTHGGKVAVNHYQSIKGAWGALPAVKYGGHIILLAHNKDKEPIGNQYYKDLLKQLIKIGLGNFYPLISSQSWSFTYDQWEIQKWEQCFLKIGGYDHLVYCTVNIPPAILETLPCISGYKLIKDNQNDIGEMLQNAIYYCVSQKKNPSMAFIKEGPYVVIRNKFKDFKR